MDSRRSEAWTGVSTCGSLRGTFGEPTPAPGLVSMRPVSWQKPRKLRTIDSLRAMVLRAYCRDGCAPRPESVGGPVGGVAAAELRPGSSANVTAKSLTSARLIAAGRSTPRSARKNANCSRSMVDALMVRRL